MGSGSWVVSSGMAMAMAMAMATDSKSSLSTGKMEMKWRWKISLLIYHINRKPKPNSRGIKQTPYCLHLENNWKLETGNWETHGKHEMDKSNRGKQGKERV